MQWAFCRVLLPRRIIAIRLALASFPRVLSFNSKMLLLPGEKMAGQIRIETRPPRGVHKTPISFRLLWSPHRKENRPSTLSVHPSNITRRAERCRFQDYQGWQPLSIVDGSSARRAGPRTQLPWRSTRQLVGIAGARRHAKCASWRTFYVHLRLIIRTGFQRSERDWPGDM